MIYRPGQQIDHYEIIRLLGQGGASILYRARDTQTDREVTLKFPRNEEIGGADIFAHFRQERKLGRYLDHPSIQRHLHPEEQSSQEYLVLEYLAGKTLRTLLQEYAPAPLPQDEALHIIIPVCEALVYLHAQGIIHQDIKPDNIFILDNGTIKIFDFGIAQYSKQKRRSWLESSLVGTPDYMAPERLLGKAGTAQTDLYALGTVLYELLSGHTPFQESDGFSLSSKRLSHDPLDLLQRNASLDPALATIVMRCIRRDASLRYISRSAAHQHNTAATLYPCISKLAPALQSNYSYCRHHSPGCRHAGDLWHGCTIHASIALK